jgi:hypothetical protein
MIILPLLEQVLGSKNQGTLELVIRLLCTSKSISPQDKEK